MLYFANWKIALICAVCALGVLLSLPNLLSSTFLARLPSWLPHKQVALGLDLRGGSYLLLEVDVAAAQRERLNSIIDNVRNALRDANIGYTGLNVESDAIVFTIREPDRIDSARQALRKIDPDLTVDIAAEGSGTLKFSVAATEARRRQAVDQSIEIIRGSTTLSTSRPCWAGPPNSPFSLSIPRCHSRMPAVVDCRRVTKSCRRKRRGAGVLGPLLTSCASE